MLPERVMPAAQPVGGQVQQPLELLPAAELPVVLRRGA